MNEIIEFCKNNSEWVKPVWFVIGIFGLIIMKNYTRPSFYKDKPSYWWIIVVLVNMAIGPLVFIASLITIINPEKTK